MIDLVYQFRWRPGQPLSTASAGCWCPARTSRGSSPRCRSFLRDRGANIVQSDQHTTDPEGGAFFMRTEFRLDGLERDADGFERGVRRRGGRAVRDGLAHALRLAAQARRDPRLALRPLPGRAAVALAARRAVRRHPAGRLQPPRPRVRGRALRRALRARAGRARREAGGRGGAARAAGRHVRPGRARALHADPQPGLPRGRRARRSSTSTTRSCRPSPAPTPTRARTSAA